MKEEKEDPKAYLKKRPLSSPVLIVMGELRRILDKDNSHYIDELKGRWHDFCQKVQFFGVWKKMLKPPMGMDKVEQAVGILRVLPSLFPSTPAPPKKLRDASEALVPVLEEKEDPNAYLKKRPLSCPVLIVSSFNCLLAVEGHIGQMFGSDLNPHTYLAGEIDDDSDAVVGGGEVGAVTVAIVSELAEDLKAVVEVDAEGGLGERKWE
ncbi:uncharacterized protein [Centroberyx affinis]|uniref:uncharacterized protein n=1 Tax=Centroberyx affinis TaxID=166261 RepID=UPI003A5C424B